VIGTAGHIDHGKTALVKRLTGVDTDRLPEEKARGISIDLGFARLVTPDGIQVGIVDVPGHERFVKNMLAGVGGIDLVLLVLAAIDRALGDLPARPTSEPARLPIDRVFTMEGFGTVVTGTLWRGRIRAGDALEILPAGHRARVRRVQVHGATVDAADAGERTAVALHGV